MHAALIGQAECVRSRSTAASSTGNSITAPIDCKPLVRPRYPTRAPNWGDAAGHQHIVSYVGSSHTHAAVQGEQYVSAAMQLRRDMSALISTLQC